MLRGEGIGQSSPSFSGWGQQQNLDLFWPQPGNKTLSLSPVSTPALQLELLYTVVFRACG